MALHEIIYVSLATREMKQAELLALLDQARVHNEAHGIVPKSVARPITDILEGAHEEGSAKSGGKGKAWLSSQAATMSPHSTAKLMPRAPMPVLTHKPGRT